MSEKDKRQKTDAGFKRLLCYAIRIAVILGIHLFLDVTCFLFAALPVRWLAVVSIAVILIEAVIFFFAAQSLGRNDHRKLVRFLSFGKGASATPDLSCRHFAPYKGTLICGIPFVISGILILVLGLIGGAARSVLGLLWFPLVGFTAVLGLTADLLPAALFLIIPALHLIVYTAGYLFGGSLGARERAQYLEHRKKMEERR
ncbi:MAG: hypothetical protein LBM78_04135 [Clostridiales bacterium]|jgi:hypothetical protein|nr:hypothetical protein [Clostridiales bacterium]